jgi:hypothetical protein
MLWGLKPYELQIEDFHHGDTPMLCICLLLPCSALPIPTNSSLLHMNGKKRIMCQKLSRYHLSGYSIHLNHHKNKISSLKILQQDKDFCVWFLYHEGDPTKFAAV